jgi:hypothetical protein
MVKLPSLEVRAKIATALCRGIGAIVFLGGVFCLGVALLTPHDRLGPLVGGLIMLALGLAFLTAKAITAGDLAARIRDL